MSCNREFRIYIKKLNIITTIYDILQNYKIKIMPQIFLKVHFDTMNY